MLNDYEWAERMRCSITVCDAEGVIIYMNEAARQAYARRGDLIGKNLMDCHNERSRAIIRRMISTCGTNAYTTEKRGQHKMIYQSAWRKADGTVGGVVEISMPIAADIPHYVRG